MKHIFFYFSLFRSHSFLSLSFLVFFLPCLLFSIFLLCLSLHIIYFLFLILFLSLSVFYFLSCCLLSFPYDILCLSSTFSVSLSLSSIFLFSFIILLLLFSLSFHVNVFYCHYYPPVLLFRVFYLSLFCLPFLLISTFFFLFFFSYFVLFSILFNYLVLILDFSYCKSSLFFLIFSINLYYLYPFSLSVFFTKRELFSFFTFQHMLCGVF